MGEPETWGLLLGVVSPLAIAVIEQPTWSSGRRMIVAWVAALVVGFLAVAANGQLDDGSTLLRTLALTLVAAQATYTGWKHGPARVIEHATSPRA